MAKILLIEDNPELARVCVGWLASERHIVESVPTGEAAIDKLSKGTYDLLIVDWELPGMSGVDVVQKYRQSGGTSMVLFLTGRNKLNDKAAGFGSGADDYLTKPFHFEELMMRVEALLRRPAGYAPSFLQAGWIVLDRQNLRVTCDGKDVHLARLEFNLLEFFLRHQMTVFTAEDIIKNVWSNDAGGSVPALRTSIKKLREKIDKRGLPSPIKSVHSIGYKFEI